MHDHYLRWNATVYFDYTADLESLLSPPVLPYSPRRSSKENLLLRYRLMFKCWGIRCGRRLAFTRWVSVGSLEVYVLLRHVP